MPVYHIPECNITKLEGRLATIARKCQQYGCDFSYRRLGEGFETFTHRVDGVLKEFTMKVIDIEVDGVAIAESGWELVGIITAMDGGNVIRQFDSQIQIPTYFQHVPMSCDHCHSNRHRAQTCILYNPERNEWKQVGTSCLKDYTGSLNAATAAAMMSFVATCEEAAEFNPDEMWSSGRKYFPVRSILLVAAECIRHWGYVKTTEPRATAYLAYDIYKGLIGDEPMDRNSQRLVDSVNFDPHATVNEQLVDGAIEYILDADTSNDNYLHNLQVITRSEYFTSRELGIIVSLLPTYQSYLRKLEREAQWAAEREKRAQGAYLGEVGQRITVDIQSARLVTSWENMYGWTGMYEFTTTSGDLVMWSTSAWVDLDKPIVRLTGTVSEHTEYQGAPQTWVKRAKLEYGQKPEKPHPEAHTEDVDEAMDMLYTE